MAGASAQKGKPEPSQDEVSDATLRSFFGYNMKRAFNTVQTDVNRALAPFGLRMVTFSALVIIVDNPGLRQSQLADVLSIERPNLVLIVDDLLATGGTAEAGIKLIERMGAQVVGCAFVIDLPDLGGRKKLEAMGMDVHALCAFAGD